MIPGQTVGVGLATETDLERLRQMALLLEAENARLHQDPLAGDCFLFVNRLRTRAKVLLWDGTGLCVYHKRLEQGRFAALWAPDGAGTPGRTLTLSELSLFLEGCTLLARTALSPGAVTPRTWTPPVSAA